MDPIAYLVRWIHSSGEKQVKFFTKYTEAHDFECEMIDRARELTKFGKPAPYAITIAVVVPDLS